MYRRLMAAVCLAAVLGTLACSHKSNSSKDEESHPFAGQWMMGKEEARVKAATENDPKACDLFDSASFHDPDYPKDSELIRISEVRNDGTSITCDLTHYNTEAVEKKCTVEEGYISPDGRFKGMPDKSVQQTVDQCDVRLVIVDDGMQTVSKDTPECRPYSYSGRIFKVTPEQIERYIATANRCAEERAKTKAAEEAKTN